MKVPKIDRTSNNLLLKKKYAPWTWLQIWNPSWRFDVHVESPWIFNNRCRHAHMPTYTHRADEVLVTRHCSTYRWWMCYIFCAISRDVTRNAFEHNRKEDFAPSGFQSWVFRFVQCCNITTIRGTRTLGLDSCILCIEKWSRDMNNT
jgi:hypothetical protein